MKTRISETRRRETSEIGEAIVLQLNIVALLAKRLNDLGDVFTIALIRSESDKLKWELDILNELLDKYQKRIS